MTLTDPVQLDPADHEAWRAWADTQLAPLDLSVELLHHVIEAGQRRRGAASPLAPPIATAVEHWGTMVAALRTLTGWRPNDAGNLARTIHPSGRFYVVVRTGAGDVGALNPVVGPTNKHPLGTRLCRIIDGLPPSTMPLFDTELAPVNPETYHEPTLWLFLWAYRDGAIHTELCQPASRDGEVITGYTQRIPLPPVTFGETAVEPLDDGAAGPELDIQPLL